MLQINISTRPLQLEYTIKNAQLNLQTTPTKLQMQTTRPLLEIRQPQGELTIDSTPSRYSIGLKNNADFARDNAEFGRQTVMNTIARIAQEGHILAAIENKTNAIAKIVANSTLSEVPPITLAPIEAPNISYQASPVQFNLIEGKINFNMQPGSIQGDYQPGSVDFRVTQYPSITMSTVDVKV